MGLLAWPGAALAWLGRQGTRALAASIIFGFAVPQLAATFKPLVPEAMFFLLVFAFLRVEPRALRGYLARPGLVALATVWMMLVWPALLGLLLLATGMHTAAPELFLGLILQAASSPIMSAPTFAALIGLDAALSLATLLTSVAATPFTTPAFVYLFVDTRLALSPTQLGTKLFLLLAGSAAVAYVARRIAGDAWIVQQKQRIDGLSVITLFIFAVAVMDGVAALLWNRPAFALGLLALAFALSLGSMAVTAALFLWAGGGRAMALGWSAANRNVGLMLAAMGSMLPEVFWIYVGLAQLPIYLLPMLLQALVERRAKRAR